MVKHESDCVNCGLPCLGESCPHYSRVSYYCDSCEEEIDGPVYSSDDEDCLCRDCFFEMAKDNFEDIFSEFEDEIVEYLGYKREY